MTSFDRDRAQGFTGGAVAMLLLGTSMAVTPTLAGYPVLAGQAARYAVAALLLLALRPLMGVRAVRPDRRELGRLVLLAAVGMAGFNVLLIAATAYTAPAVVASVVGTAPLALSLADAWSHRRLPDARVLAGAVVVSLGVVIAQGAAIGAGPGLLLALAATGCEVGFTLLAAPLLPRLGAVNVSTYGCGLAVPLLALGAAMAPGRDLVVPDGTQLFGLLWSAVVMTALAFCLWYAAVARLGGARAGLLTGLIPWGALIGSAVVTGSVPAPMPVLGALLAGLGIALAMLPRASAPTTVRSTHHLIEEIA